MIASAQSKARQLADTLVANGANFTFKPAQKSLPASFTYELGRGGDRWRCRGLILEAQADPALWSAVVAEIGARCGGGADA